MIDYPLNIHKSGLSIYDSISPSNQNLFIPTHELERILSTSIVGLSLTGLPLKTRSKTVKQEICKALGYPIPSSFKRTKPRFPGQNFDVYTQKGNNVQIWNEVIDEHRRYVLLHANEKDIITNIRVITGYQLIKFDRTGTLTQKFQARMQAYGKNICSVRDSKTVAYWAETNSLTNLSHVNPNDFPRKDQLLRISEIYRRLLPMVGKSLNYIDATQERNRGAELHSMICENLGYSIYEDDGTYPDIFNQLLEIKLQTSPTIDLGLHSPKDGEPIVSIDSTTFYSKDIRYAIFDGDIREGRVYLDNLYLVTGEDFTTYFPLFQGNGTNKKLQIPLPPNFFNN